MLHTLYLLLEIRQNKAISGIFYYYYEGLDVVAYIIGL